MILLCWYKRYSICIVSFFNLYELFPAFISANNIGSLVNNLFIVKTFNAYPTFSSSSSPSSGGIGNISVDSSLSIYFSDHTL